MYVHTHPAVMAELARQRNCELIERADRYRLAKLLHRRRKDIADDPTHVPEWLAAARVRNTGANHAVTHATTENTAHDAGRLPLCEAPRTANAGRAR